MKIFISILLFVRLVKESLAGTLLPEVVDSVLPYRNNEQAIGKYTFTFKMSSPVPSNPRITIDFPNIYPKLLANVDNCQGTVEVKLKSEKFNFACVVTGTRVSFDVSSQWSELDAGNIVVEVFDIINPTGVAKRSTGYFQVRTWSGIDLVIDSNTAFDSIAFAPAYKIFPTTPSPVTIVNDGANVAGYTTNYILTFANADPYPIGSWFRLTLPSGFDFKPPLECYVIEFEVELANLPCYSDGQVLVMKGLQKQMNPGVYRIKMRNIVNPKIAVPVSPNFIFESMREGVFTVIEYYDQIAGVAIKPGTVTDVTVIGFPLVMNLYVDYSIKFLPANVVPRGGSIHIRFPVDFSQTIDKTCRVSYGLKAANSAGIKCVTNGLRDLYISNFQELVPQYIEVKCFAYNPPQAGETQNFEIETYTGAFGTQVIDENPRAGTVVISSIDKPNFMDIDFYVKHVNCSFYQDCPINFRYFPLTNFSSPALEHIFNPTTDPHNNAIASSYFNSLSLQIPIWWLLMGNGPPSNIPECLFGKVPAAHCYQYQHVVSLIIPSSQGYSYCELPVSINNVKVSPIPGRFPFRIWSFKQGSKIHAYTIPSGSTGWSYSANKYSVPVEQDTYIMDISITGIAVLQTWNSASEAGDVDNLLHLRSNVHPFLFAWSGAVDVVITHVEDSLQDKAVWPFYGGKPSIPINSYREIPCKLYQSGNPTGYLSWFWDSASLRCMMKVGSIASKDPTHIMVTGFDSNIDKGNYYEMYIPDVAYCTTINRQCKLLYTYTMTEDPIFPYRVSQREQSLGKVVTPMPSSFILDTTLANAGTLWGRTWRSNNNRCVGSSLNMNLYHDKDVQMFDYFLFKRDMGHWHVPFFRSDRYELSASGIGVIGNPHMVLNKDAGQEYIILRSPMLVPATGPTPATLPLAPANAGQVRQYSINWFSTSPFKGQKASTDAIVWTGKLKKIRATLKLTDSATSNDNGFYSVGSSKTDVYGGLPWENQNWWTPASITFTNCLDIPANGEIQILFNSAASPTGLATPYSPSPTTCRVWPRIRKQKANNTEVSCNYDTTLRAFIIKTFDYIPMRTPSRVTWHHLYRSSTSIGALQFRILGYNATGSPATVLSEWSNTNPTPSWLGLTGAAGEPLANNWEYLGHYEYAFDLYEGSYGKFVWEVEVGDAMAWNPAEDWTFVATMPASVIYNNGNLECRYALKDTVTGKYGHPYPGVDCTYVNVPDVVGPPLVPGYTKITMKLHPLLDIAATSRYQIWIDTRSTDTLDGLQFTKYGIYSVNLESFQGATKKRGGKRRYEVFGPKINHFAVWSSNKIAGEHSFLTYYVDFINSQGIKNSLPTLANFQTIMLYFDTQITYVPQGGYSHDLGMLNYPDQSNVPCNLLVGISYWNLPLTNTAICTIYYGYSESPARIKIEGFINFNTRVFRVDIPFVLNPGKPGVVPRTWLKILETSVTGTTKNTVVVFEGHYYELNTTWTRNTTRYPITNSTYSTPAVTFSVNTLDTIGTLTLPFMTPASLHANDFVLIKFPIYWPAPWAIDWTKCSIPGGLLQQRCYSIRNDDKDAHYVYFQLAGTLPTSSTLRFEVPSARAMTPPTIAGTAYFEMYLYHDTRLIAVNRYTGLSPTMFIADPITGTVNCLPTSAVTMTQNEYIVTFILPHNLLGKSEIRIDYVDYSVTPNPNCTSTTNSMLTGPVKCSILPNPGSFSSVIDFDPIDKAKKVEIKIPLQNNAVLPGPRNWRIRTYYLRGNYYYVNGDSQPFNHAAGCNVVATAAATVVPWATWFHKFQRTRTGERGPLVFIFESSVTLTKSTPGDYVLIRIPTAFQFEKAQKAASWDMHYPYLWEFKVVGSNHEIKVWAPKTIDIVAGTRYMINITTLNGLSDVNGFIYPPQLPNHYTAQIEVIKGGVLTEMGDAKIFVFRPNFPKFETKAYLINAGYKAAFNVQFQLPSAYTYGATPKLAFRFRIPTATYKYRQRINLFADDAGTGKNNGDTINCHFYDVTTRNPVSATCYFYKGSQDSGIPAYVELMTTASLAASTSYAITFDGFKHPATATDNMNVEPSLEFYDTAGVHQFTGIDYDYTISTDSTPTFQNAYSPAPVWDTMIIGSTNVGVNLKFVSPVPLYKFQNTNGVGWADYLIIEFPEGYIQNYNLISKAKLVAGSGLNGLDGFVEFAAGNNWLIWRININTLSAATLYELRLQNVDQAKSLPPIPVIKMFIVSDRELKSVITYVPMTGFTAPAIGPAEIQLVSDEMPAGSIPKLKYQRWALTFTHLNAPIPVGGAIQIILPTSLQTNVDDHCTNLPTSSLKGVTYNSATAPMDQVYCKYDSATTSYIITNFANSPATDTIRLNFYTNSPAAASGNVIIRAFKDTARLFQILEGTIAVPAIATTLGFDQLMSATFEDEKPDVVRDNEAAHFSFEYRVPSVWTTATVLTVTIPSNVAVPTGAYVECFYDQIEARECIVASASSPLTIQILAPHSPALVIGNQYTVSIRSRCGPNGERGLLFSQTAGPVSATVSDGSGSASIQFEVFAPNFFYIQPLAMNSNSGQLNGFAFTFKPTVGIPAGGFIRIKFPRVSEKGKFTLWGSMGTPGSTVADKCMHLIGLPMTAGTTLTCTYNEDAFYNIFQMTGFNAVSASVEVGVVIYDITNPTVTNDYVHIDAIVETTDASGNLLNQGVAFDIMSVTAPVTGPTTTSITGAYTRSSTTLGASGAQYTFPSINVNCNSNDQIVFDFPPAYYFSGTLTNCNTGGLTGTYTAYGKYIVFRPTATVAATVNLCFSGVTNPTAANTQAIRIYVVNNRVYSVLYSHATGAWAGAVAPTITLTTSPGNHINSGSKYRFTIDTTTTVPAGGAFAFRFPSTYTIQGISVVPGSPGFPPGATFRIDNTLAGNTIGVIEIPAAYSKAANGVATFDVYVKNPPTSAVYNAIVSVHSTYSNGATGGLWTSGSIAATVGSTAAITCSLDGTTFTGSTGTTIAALNAMTPTAVALTSTLPAYPGYEMFNTPTGNCNGLPVYTSPATVLTGGATDLYHLTIKKPSLLNAVKITGVTPQIFKATGRMQVDFSNNDLTDLGMGIASGAPVPCEVRVGGTIIDTTCTHVQGTFYNPPGVNIRFYANIASGSNIQIVISKFSNPSTVRKMEVVFRYYEQTYGSRTLDLVYLSTLFSITDNAAMPAVATGTLTVSPTIVQTSPSLTFTLAAADTGMMAMIFSPAMINNRKTFPATTGVDEVLHGACLTVRNSVTATSVVTTLYDLPVSVPATSTWTVVTVDSTLKAIGVRTFTAAPTLCTPTVTLTALSKNNQVGTATYSLKWVSTCDFSRGSVINVRINTFLTAYQIVSYSLISATTTLPGPFTVSTDGTTIFIKDFDYAPAGTTEIQLKVFSGTYNAGGTATGLFQVSLYGTNIVNLAPSSALLTSGGGASLSADKFRTYMLNRKPAVRSDSGYLSFLFKTAGAIAATDKIVLKPATTMLSATAYVRCKFTNLGVSEETALSFGCSVSAGAVTILMPRFYTLTNSVVYRLDIYYVAEQLFGFAYPGASGTYSFNVKLTDSVGTTKEEFVTALTLMKALPPWTCMRNFVSNTGLKNVFMVGFSSPFALAASKPTGTGYLEVQFPNSVVSAGLATGSYDRLAGLTVYNAQAVKCTAWTVSGSTKTASGALYGCYVSYGGYNNIHRYTSIKIIHTGLAANTKYQFDIYGVNNPTTANIMNYVRFIGGSGTDVDTEFTDNFQLHTVTATSTTAATQTLPTLSPSTIQMATNINLNIATTAMTSLVQDINHVRLLYNADMNNPAMTATNFEPFDVIPGLGYFYSKTTNPISFTMALQNFNTPASATPTFTSSFKAQLIKQKIVMAEIPYTSTQVFVAIPYTSAVVPTVQKTVLSNNKQSLSVALTLSKIISMTGSIELYVKNMASVDPNCNEGVPAVIGANFKCEVVNPTTLRISGLSRDLQVGEVVTINFRATTNTLTTGQVCAKGFNDYPAVPTAQVQSVQLETCDTLTYSAKPGIVWFEARTPTRIRRVQAGPWTAPVAPERGMMTFLIAFPAATYRMTGYVRLTDTGGNFGNLQTKDFECFFTTLKYDDYISKSCSYDGATKTWTVRFPRNTDLSGPTTLTITTARQFFQYVPLPYRDDGILMPQIGGVYPLTSATYNAAGALTYTSPETSVVLPSPHFTKHFLNSYLVMKDAYSTFHIKVRPVIAIPATPNGVIKIDFKVMNRYNLNVFNPDLGTGILNGFPYDCPSATGGFVSKCRLFLGNANSYASILVDPQSTMAPTTDYDIDFPALLNPTLNMTEVIMEVTSQTLVSSSWVNQATEHVDVFVAQEIIVTPTLMGALPWLPNDYTGEPSTVSFTFTPTIAPVKSSTTSFDRVVIKVDRTELDILNDQLVAGKILTCAGYAIKIFQDKLIIELSTTTGVPIGSPVTITCTNYLNQQYVIRGGVKHSIELWVDGMVSEVFQWQANVAIPNKLTVKSVAISALTPEISSFDTYTFIIKPYNYMPAGSRFEINFPDTFSGMINCQIVSGLNGGICQTVTSLGGLARIKISQYKLWNPDIDPSIKITIDMNSPPTAGTYTFNFVSYWKENIPTPSLEDKIDEDVIGSITYNPFTPFTYLRLERMFEYTREQCNFYWWEGVVKWKFAFKENFVYPHYLVIHNIQGFYWDSRNGQEWVNNDPFRIEEYFCYFDYDHITFSAKSEKCYFSGGHLYIMVPEELPLLSGNNYTISLDSRGQWDRGFSFTDRSDYRYYTYGRGYFATVPPTGPNTLPTFTAGFNSGPLNMKERPCYFGRRDYDSTNWHQDHNSSLEIQDSCNSYSANTWTPESGNKPTPRFQVQFSTFNEFKDVSYENLGWFYLTAENQTDGVACNYWHHQLILAIPNSYKWDWNIACEVHNVKPTYADYFSRYAVMTMYNYTNQRDNDFSFRYGWAGKINYKIKPMPLPPSKGGGTYPDEPRNTFVHMITQAQTEFEDGTYIDNQRVIHWYHADHIKTSIVDKAAGPSTNAATPYETGVKVTWTDRQFGIIHVEQRAQVLSLVPSIGGRVWVHWELEDPWWHLTRNLTHGSRYCRNDNTANDVVCNQYGIPFRWSYWLFNGIGGALDVKHFGLMESPAFVIGGPPAHSPLVHTKRIDIVLESGNAIRRVFDGPLTCSERVPYYIFEMDDPVNPESADMVYRIGVWSINTYENNTNIVRMWITNDFPVIGPDTTNCKILFGFKRPNFDLLPEAYSPLCKITPNDMSPLSPTPGGYHRVEFYNLYRWSRRWFDQYESWMIFEIKMKNPPTERWPAPSAFKGFVNDQIWPLVNESRYNYRIGIEHDQGRSWVGGTTPMVANYFRVVRNRKTFEERRQKAGEWAELHMRLYPKYYYPKDISKVEIQIPDTYDIPNGGTKICEVGHDYHTDLPGQFCEISNERKIQVMTNQNFGLYKRCTIVRITTDKSVKNNNGFQAPATAAVQSYSVNLYIGTKRIEYTDASGTPQPSKLISTETLNITANVIEINKESTLNLSFHADRAVRAGYDTVPEITDVFKKPPQGVIYLKFYSVDKYTSGTSGFKRDLGYANPPNINGADPYEVPCQPFRGLVPKTGETIKCTVYPEAFAGYYTPTVMMITNFEAIAEKTEFVQVHILKLPWVQNSNNWASVEFSVYEKFGDGTLQKIYDDVKVNVLALPSAGVALTIVSVVSPLQPYMTPDIVGARSTLTVPFSTTIPLYQQDTVEVLCPTMMILPEASDISAVFKVTPHALTGVAPYTVVADVVVYKVLNRVNFILPRSASIYSCTTTRPCTVNIVAAGFRHVPYEIATTLTYEVRIISKKTVFQNFRYTQIPPPTVGPFNSILAMMSSQFSEDIYVKYDFMISPSYNYPAGSKVVIDLDWPKYRHIDKSNPPATCYTNFASITATCIISEAKITVTLSGQLDEGYSATITAVGVKNPSFVGQIDPTDIKITAYHPTNNRINTQYANQLLYKPKKNVDTIIFKIELSSYYSRVSSDYTFTLQNTNTLPPYGILNIMLPKTWSQKLLSPINVVSITGGFTKEKLIFQQAAIKQPSENILLQIIPQFEWPSKQKLIVKLDTIVNPDGITITEPFNIYTQYDSVTIDQSDVTDPASSITLLPYNPKIRMWTTIFSPKNEGEVAEYDLSITCDEPISNGQSVVFQFPPGYNDILTQTSLSIVCSSPSHPIGVCTVKNRFLYIPVLADLAIREQIDFVISGIANPNSGAVYFVDVSINNPDGTVVQFVNDAFSIETIQGATYAPISQITTLKNQILIKSDYEQCMDITGNIPLGAAILLDFPKQFDMRKDSYVCKLGTNHDSTVLSYPNPTDLGCTIYKNLKRIEITGHTAAYTHTAGPTTAKKICYIVKDLENSKDTGESFHFNMRVFDVKNRKMLYKTAGILNYPSTLTYVREGLRIFVDAIPDIPLGTMSNDIKVTLENPVPYDVVLIPSCPDMEFIPPRIVFKFYEGQTQTFRINPDISIAKAKQYSISWVKEEQTTTPNRFSEMTDTFFNVVAQPDYRQLKLTVSQSVYRASIGAQSMPIYVTLSHPASTPMTLFYKTKKPFQPEFVKFDPESVTFQPGEKVKMFNYKTTQGAVSGLIDLQLQPEFRDIYYLPTPEINFEIEDVDKKPPSIVEYNLISKQMKSMKMRVSSDESTKIYYVCSIKGTMPPTVAEMRDPAVRALSQNKPRTPEIQGSQYSTITSQTKSYVYFDSYLDLQGLESNKDYSIFMMPEDLSGNVGEIKQFDFKTEEVPPPVTFKLKSAAAISDDNLLQALSLVSGITKDKFVITYRPAFSTIPTSEKEVTDVLSKTNMEYEIMILPDVTTDGKTPYDYVKKIEEDKDVLFTELPSLDKTQIISESGKEISFNNQKFTYMPQLVEVSNFHALFNVSVFYTGTVYGVILPAGEKQPSAQQVKDGLTSVNRQVLDKYTAKVRIEVNPDKQYKIYPSGFLNFTFLYHSSPYVAYFIAERETYGDPVLMADNEVLSVKVKTLREIFKVEDSVVELGETSTILKVTYTWIAVFALLFHTLFK